MERWNDNMIKNTRFADNEIDKLVYPENTIFDASNTFENNNFDITH